MCVKNRIKKIFLRIHQVFGVHVQCTLLSSCIKKKKKTIVASKKNIFSD